MNRISPRTVARFRPMLFALGLLYCALGCGPVPQEYRVFLEMSGQQQREYMEQLPVDRQIDFYLAGQMYAHPPLRMGNYIARRGKEALPFLLERLEKEKRAAWQVQILHVLEDMNMYYYNLKDEKQAIEAMRKVVAEMKDQLHKPRAERALESIESQQVLLPNRPL